jgi:hypothetical protein
MSIAGRLLAAARAVLAEELAALRDAAGAAEVSLLLPASDASLVFFASTNPALTAPDVPAVPINASFAGLAYRTGQTIAYADAAQQAAHFVQVDQHLGVRTREYAVIPIQGSGTAGVLTLVNRPAAGAQAQPFTPAELASAAACAQDLAGPIGTVSQLLGAHPDDAAVAPELLADLAALTAAERRVAHAVIAALIENRSV